MIRGVRFSLQARHDHRTRPLTPHLPTYPCVTSVTYRAVIVPYMRASIKRLDVDRMVRRRLLPGCILSFLFSTAAPKGSSFTKLEFFDFKSSVPPSLGCWKMRCCSAFP